MNVTRFLAMIVCSALTALPVSATFCVPPARPSSPPPPATNPPHCDPQCHNCSRSPCYLAPGTYVDELTDLQIPTAGMVPLSVSRRYDSARPADGPMGAGWSSSLTPRLYYAAYLLSAPNTYLYEADIMMPNGALSRFTSSGGTWNPPFGRRDTLNQNANGTWSLTPQSSRSVFLFNADGSLQSFTDEYGNAITYTYDANGRIQRMADGAGSGRYIDVTWGPDGRIASVADNSGRTVKYFYETSNGTLTSVSDPLVSSDASQRSTYYSYVAGRFGPVLSRIADRWHRVLSTITWFADGKLESYTEGDYNEANPSASTGEKYSYTYGGSTATKSDSFGTRTYSFNPDGLVTDRVSYNGSGLPATITDDFATTTYTWNSRGNVLTMSIGGVTFTYTYDPAFPDQVASIGSNQPATWPGSQYTYWSSGNPAPGALKEVRQLRKDGTTADLLGTYSYTSRGRVTSSTTGEGQAIYGYNAAGDLTSVQAPPGTTTYAYDSIGRMTSSTDVTGQTTTYTYDALGRALSVTPPKPTTYSTLNFAIAYSYDNYDPTTGLVFTNATDPNGRVTKQGYDALGRVVKTIDAANNATSYSYQYNLLRSITDANENLTTYAYDANRSLSTTTFPNGSIESYVRGQSGTLTQVTDRKGTLRRYTYDAFGRVTLLEYPAYNAKFTYSWLGNLPAGATEWVGSIARSSDTVEYDNSFRVQKEERQGGYKITYAYATPDPQALISSYAVTPPAGSSEPPVTVSYDYDGAKRVTSISSSTIPGYFTIAYAANGQYDTITYPSGQQRKYQYDLQGRLSRVSNTLPGLVNIGDYEYGYDYNWAASAWTMLGQRTSVNTIAAPNTGGQLNGTTQYHYDALYQLQKAVYPDQTSDEWTYDAIGNRTSSTIYGVQTNYSYYQNGSGKNTARLQSYTGSNSFTYDANGNTTSGRSGPFTWDHANRLTNFSNQVYEYDASGRRTLVGPSTASLSLIHQGFNVVRERNLSGVRNDYIFAPGIDEPLARQSASGAVTYFAIDGLGSITAEVENGAIVDGARYRPFGDSSSLLSRSRFAYTGREPVDTGSNLYFHRARYYDAVIGRFISEDPLQELFPIVGGLLYSYVRNSPVMFDDPFGLLERCRTRVERGTPVMQRDEWSERWDLFSTRQQPWIPRVPLWRRGRLPRYGTTLYICDWYKYFVSTSYWTTEVAMITTCDCPPSEARTSMTEGEIREYRIRLNSPAERTYGIGVPCSRHTR